MAPPRTRPVTGRFYVTLDQAAWLADLSGAQFHQTVRPGIPAEAIKRKGLKVLIDGRAALKAVITYRARLTVGSSGGDEDPLLGEHVRGGSVGLERYRAVRAEMAAMDLEERAGTHIPLKKLSTALQKFGGLLQRGGEALQRRFGAGAAEIYNNAVDGALAEMSKELEQREPAEV